MKVGMDRAYTVTADRDNLMLVDYVKDGYIMVIDDEKNMRNTVRNMLRMLGVVNVELSEDGDAALLVLNAKENCKFALIDWNMPRMPGIQLVHEIRASEGLKDLNILMITAENYKNQLTQAIEYGINGFVLKPFVAKTLEDKMLNIINIKSNPPEHVKLLKVGEKLVEGGKFKEALEIFSKSREMKESARILVNIGEVHEKMGDSRTALQFYKEAIKMNPEYLKAQVAAGNLCLREGNESTALMYFENASEISPNNALRKTAMGEMYMKRNENQKAYSAFNDAVTIDPGKSNEIAEVCMSSGKSVQAEKFFRVALKKDHKNLSEKEKIEYVHIYNRLGIALRKQGKWEDAIMEYKKALMLDREDEGLHYNMGKSYLEGMSRDKAMECFEKALKHDSDFKEAKEEVAKLQALKNKKKA